MTGFRPKDRLTTVRPRYALKDRLTTVRPRLALKDRLTTERPRFRAVGLIYNSETKSVVQRSGRTMKWSDNEMVGQQSGRTAKRSFSKAVIKSIES